MDRGLDLLDVNAKGPSMRYVVSRHHILVLMIASAFLPYYAIAATDDGLTAEQRAALSPEQITALNQALEALQNLSPCERMLVEEVVLQQGRFSSQKDFQGHHRALEALGISFEEMQHREYALSIEADLTSHRVLSETIVKRGPIETIFFSFETRVGVPFELAAKVSRGYGIWPRLPDGTFYSVEADSNRVTLGVAKLLAYQFQIRDQLSLVHESAENLVQPAISRATIYLKELADFYRSQIKRRKWPESFVADLMQDILAYAGISTTSIIRYNGVTAGTIQIARAPYGRIVASTDPEGQNVFADEAALIGEGVRRFGIGGLRALSQNDDLQLYSKYCSQRDENGRLPQVYTPVEAKLMKNGMLLTRVCPIRWRESHRLANGQQIFWFRGDGEINEHMRFAIDPKLSSSVFVEIMLHLFASAVDPQFEPTYNREQRMYFTYGDRPGLYSWAGYRSRGDQVIVGKTSEFEGIEMALMQVSGADHIEALLNVRRSLQADDQARLDEIKASVSQGFTE